MKSIKIEDPRFEKEWLDDSLFDKVVIKLRDKIRRRRSYGI